MGKREKDIKYVKKRKLFSGEYSEKSEYLSLKWDYEHNMLIGYKKKRYEELKEKYEGENEKE